MSMNIYVPIVWQRVWPFLIFSKLFTFGLKNAFGFGPIRESRDVEFFEHVFPMKVSIQNSCLPDASSSTLHLGIALSSETLELRRSKRARIQSIFGPILLPC